MLTEDARRLQVLAWAIVVAAFGVFSVVAIGGPLTAARYLAAATTDEVATVELQAGSVTLERGGAAVLLEPAGLGRAPVREGAVLVTHGDGRAHVTFFDASTANVEPNTRLRFVAMRRPRFSSGDSTAEVVLELTALAAGGGRVSLGTTWLGTEMRLRTRDALVKLGPESRVRIELDDGATRVHAQDGSAEVTAQGATVVLGGDRVTVVPAGGEASPPRPALTNILANGDFRRPPGVGWVMRAEGQPHGSARSMASDGRWALAMDRGQSEGRPGDVVLVQNLKAQDVTGATYLGISATFRIDHQSLAAGGERDTEYPLSLKLVVERQGGAQDVPWEVGFYAVDAGAEESTPPGDLGILGVPVPRGKWVTFATGNLLDASEAPALVVSGMAESWTSPEALSDVERFGLGPRRLLRFEIKGSGHDWTTYVDDVGLWVK